LGFFPPVAICGAVFGENGIGGRVGIEHRELALLGEKRLMIVRTVEIDEMFADFFKESDRDG